MQSEGIEPCIMQKGSEKAYTSQDAMSSTSQVLEKKVVTAVKQIPEAELNVAPANNKIPPLDEIKEAAVPEMSIPGISTLPQIQKEWTCAMCQVTVSSEKTLMCHLRGSRHKATCEKLTNVKNQASKDNASVPSASKSSKTLRKEPAKCASSSSTTREESNQKSGRRRAGKSDLTKESPAKGGGDKIKPESNQQKMKGQQEIENSNIARKEPEKCASSNGTAHNESNQTTGRRQAEKSDKPKERPAKSVGDKIPKCMVKAQQEIAKNEFVQVKNDKFWCSICNVSCTGADNMVSHLGGKKHLSRIQN
ncbi:hypothetical protein SLEP1_g488 [Rubroshorea leprosula]|uniref:C2H2-type domain-containing protein n=2 Tax=Rubroshorea leprosula TaxID=152421 RepID=A0AAV5HJE9_9ROSI|nr:hypothetical protein SLEP1_g488 [Rubroshorea leprosula]